MEVATAAKAPSSRLARSLAATAPCYNKGVSVFFAALVAGALVSACWMSVSARLQVTPITPVATPGIARNAATGPEAPGRQRRVGHGPLASARARTKRRPRGRPVPRHRLGRCRTAPPTSGGSTRTCGRGAARGSRAARWRTRAGSRPSSTSPWSRAAVRGALRPAAVLPDAGRVHAVGHPAAAPPLPRPRPGPRPHVRL